MTVVATVALRAATVSSAFERVHRRSFTLWQAILTRSVFEAIVATLSFWVQCDAQEVKRGLVAHRKPWRHGSRHRFGAGNGLSSKWPPPRNPPAGLLKPSRNRRRRLFSPEWPNHDWEVSPKPAASPLESGTNNPTPPKKRRLADFNLPLFPVSHLIGGVHYFIRSEVEDFKRLLIGLPPEPVVPGAPIRFVTIGQLASELSTSKATIKRRSRARKLAAETAPAAAAAPVAKRAPARRGATLETV